MSVLGMPVNTWIGRSEIELGRDCWYLSSSLMTLYACVVIFLYICSVSNSFNIPLSQKLQHHRTYTKNDAKFSKSVWIADQLPTLALKCAAKEPPPNPKLLQRYFFYCLPLLIIPFLPSPKYWVPGGLSASLSHTLTVPIDVIKTKQQIDEGKM